MALAFAAKDGEVLTVPVPRFVETLRKGAAALEAADAAVAWPVALKLRPMQPVREARAAAMAFEVIRRLHEGELKRTIWGPLTLRTSLPNWRVDLICM